MALKEKKVCNLSGFREYMTFFFLAVTFTSTMILPYEAAASEAKGDDTLGEVLFSASKEQEAVTLAELLDYAVENNSRVKASRLNWQRMIQKYPQATALDDPMLTYTYPIEKVETRLGPQEHVLMFSQKIPFPGKLGLKGKIVKKEIEIAKTMYEKSLRDLEAKVKKSYFDLFYIDHATQLARENKAVLDYFRDVSRTNYSLDVSELDELVRAQKLQAKASFDLIVLSDMRVGAVARLNTLLDREPTYAIARLEDPPLPPFERTIDELYDLATKNYEELKIAGLKVEKSGLEERLSRYRYRPDFRVGFNYSVIGEPPMAVAEAGQDAYGVTFGINIPLWFNKNKAAVREAAIGREKSLIEKNAVLKELHNNVKRVYYDLTSAESIIRLYGDSLVPEARESLDFAEARYKNGEERLGRLLETQSMWLNFRLVYYRAASDFLKSVAELERLTGEELTERF